MCALGYRSEGSSAIPAPTPGKMLNLCIYGERPIPQPRRLTVGSGEVA